MANKKGDFKETAPRLILALVIGGIIIFGGVTLYAGLKEANPIEACRLSVLAVDKTKLTGKETVFTLDCPAQAKTVKKQEVSQGGKVSEALIKKQMAEQMRMCWYKMGEGKLNGFESAMWTNKNSCVICSKLSFDKSIEESLKNQATGRNPNIIDGYLSYLHMAKLPNGNTYAQYLKGTAEEETSHLRLFYTANGEVLSGDSDSFVLLNEKGLPANYYIVFQVIDHGWFEKSSKKGACSFVAGAAGLIGGGLAAIPSIGFGAPAGFWGGASIGATACTIVKSLILTQKGVKSSHVWAVSADDLPYLECEITYM